MRLQQLATELVQRRLAVIVTTGNGSALAARSASTTIPLVFLSQGAPVQFGLVESLSRPAEMLRGWLSFLRLSRQTARARAAACSGNVADRVSRQPDGARNRAAA